MSMITSPYPIQFRGRRIAHTVRALGGPRIDAGDVLRAEWLDPGGRWYGHRLAPGEELVVERIGRRLYALHILVLGDDGDRVVYTSHTRPRPTRIRGSRWWRIRLTDTDYDRRHVAYLRSTDGVVIG